MSKMTLKIVTGLVLGAGIFVSAGAFAQTPPATPPVPEVMPFDIPYGTPLSLEQAKKVAAAAAQEARSHNWKMVISVVDPNGDLVYFERMDGAMLASIAIANHKARTSAIFRRATKVYQDAVEANHSFILSVDGVIAVEGGYPLIDNGKLVGAIGCSGGASAQDNLTCKVAADGFK
jgi:uncharacterized protein GlcG (DUF336 family)